MNVFNVVGVCQLRFNAYFCVSDYTVKLNLYKNYNK